MRRVALAIQCFNKPDTLLNLLQSLLNCERINELDLVIGIDSARGHWSREAEFAASNGQVVAICDAFLKQHAGAFRGARLLSNVTNLGTCKTCKLTLDAAFSDADYVIFTEDDTVFARDAIGWFLDAEAQGLLRAEENWVVAGESVYFDARVQVADPELTHAAIAFCNGTDLLDAYRPVDFVPSTCFATTRPKWETFRDIRGGRHGANDLNDACAAQMRKSILPVVPRVKDVGMLHDLGHSVTVHGKAGVSEIKNTYLLSDQLDPANRSGTFGKVNDHAAGLLFQGTVTDLDFGHLQSAWAAYRAAARP